MSNVNKLRPLQLREGYTFTRLLIEVALASNAPTTLKVKVLFELISNVDGRLLIFVVPPPAPPRCCTSPPGHDLNTIYAGARYERRRMGPPRGRYWH
jgi:hypothetical protein